ncbi:protein-tyrosine phosphatase family protein [Salinicola halimionae]|uniref:protein-tyrosine phosphatase family protein n=1 Tax=Salinicola halimionae TaxID=1949081 RepID=UPI000DA1B8F4|nr:dual specificity protein phosphatase family protein [Salinicola halimionae]
MINSIYKIEGLCDDQFAIMPHPQGGDFLEQSVEQIKLTGYEIVISMLTIGEQAELELLAEGEVCQNKGILYLNFPIRDEVADSDREVMQFIDSLALLQKKKRKMVFHCRGGIGRSSMMLSLLAARLGVKPQESFELITQFRGEKAPETEFQRQWVTKLAEC